MAGQLRQDRELLRAAVRTGAWLAAVCAFIAVTVLLSATAATAHPALIETSPGAGYAVTSPPEAVSVTFNEPVTPVGDALTLRLADGKPIPLEVSVAQGGMSLRGIPGRALPTGSYEVSYRVVALDGDLIEGTFAFGVATPVAPGSSAGGLSQDDPDQVQPGTALPRAVLFLGLSLALGGAVGAFMARRETGALARVRPLLRVGALLGLTGAAALLLQVASLNPTAVATILRTSEPARLLAAELGLFAVALLAARAPGGRAVGVLALSGVVVLEGVRAHPGEAVGSAGVALTIVHLGSAAVWLGALVHIVRLAVAWRGESGAIWKVVGAYGRLAIRLFLLVLATGTLSALLLLPSLSDWTGTAYGQVLLLKLFVFVAATVAAVVARSRHRKGVTADRDVVDVKAGRPWVLSRAARVEAGLLAGVVILTAGLTSATPPRLVSQSALLPAPTGAVLRVAERINQVTVSIVASKGRVEAHAYAPGPEGSTEYQLDLALERPGGQTKELELQPCGVGCWTTGVEWGAGRNVLLADVTASGWEGGRGFIQVPWPPQPANDLLRTVQTVMGAQSEISAVEDVSSGFGPAPIHRSVRTGQEYLEAEPWSDGGVTDPVVHTDGDVRTLSFAMPVLGYHFEMTLDAQNRIITERVVTRKHLIERRYDYARTN